MKFPFAERLGDFLNELGDLTDFAIQTFFGLFTRSMWASPFILTCYRIGVRSANVVMLTGLFIGMVLALQAYAQFKPFGMDSLLGTITISGILSELGPVLAAVMFAGRVGSAMAAEIGTMRVTEQLDALSCLGFNPVSYLASCRFLACICLIPLLTVLADIAGIAGSTFLSLYGYGVDGHHYWQHTLQHVGLWQLITGLIKSLFFGAAVALISCHQGFRCRLGAEGVGAAATNAFVRSFIVILVLDFFLVYFFNQLKPLLLQPVTSMGD